MAKLFDLFHHWMVVIVALLLFVQISDFPIIKEWLADDIKKAAADNLKTLVFIIKGSIIIAYIQSRYLLEKILCRKTLRAVFNSSQKCIKGSARCL